MSQIEECVTLKNMSRLAKWAIEKFVGRKMCDIWKNGLVRKMGDNWKNVHELEFIWGLTESLIVQRLLVPPLARFCFPN